MWIYGLEKFCWDAEFMLQRKVTIFWRISWMIITPVLLIIIYIYFIAKLENPTFSGKEYPDEVLLSGWAIFIFGMLQVIVWGSWLVINDPNKREAISGLFKQNPEWGPKSKRIYNKWTEYKKDRLLARQRQSEKHSKFQKFYYILLGKYE